jgi:FKBP-type peptidyl-prolyl cis-trans isomerase 2
MEAQKMNSPLAGRALLCVMLAGLAGALLACKSSASKTPAAPLAVTAPPAVTAPLVVADGMKITMDMTVTLPDKTVAINTGRKEPLTFILGKHDVWPSLEVELTGMRLRERKKFVLTAEQAAGPYDESKRRTVKTEQLPLGAKVGTKIRSKNGDGKIARVVKISGDTAEIDFNDRLAGQNLIVEVTILKIEKP